MGSLLMKLLYARTKPPDFATVAIHPEETVLGSCLLRDEFVKIFSITSVRAPVERFSRREIQHRENAILRGFQVICCALCQSPKLIRCFSRQR